MELREGYKNTEIGIIPEDWEVKEFGQICYPSKSRMNPITSDRSYKCIELEHLSQGSGFLLGYANSKDLKSQKSFFEEGDVLFGKLRPYLRKFYFADFKGVCTTEIWVLKIEKDISNRFLFHLVRSDKIVEAANLSTGTKMPRAEWKTVSETKIPVPTIEEQIAIATALSDADALINSLEKLIAKKRNIKQGAMQKLLQPKEGWEVKKLGDFLDYEQPTEYLVTDTEYNDNNQIPVLTAGKTFILGYTNEEHGIFRNLPVIIFDDFTTAIKYVDFPFKAKSSAMKMLIPKTEKVNMRFIFEIMLQIKYQVADHKRHWIGEYSKIEIKVPSTPEEQTHIATILSEMDAEIQALETKLEKYCKIKLGMMQNLLTGKIRLV